jgi:para-aminobenzoate synthetase/4-amino-4-deoxychorismate lyase
MLQVAENECLVRDAATGAWLHFRRPLRIVSAPRLEAVPHALAEAEAAVEGQGLHAAGFIAYEAARALDPALAVRPIADFPLVWLGLYGAPAAVEPDRPTGVTLAGADWAASADEAAYREAIGRIREAIRAGETYQVNHTYRLRAPFRADPLSGFLELAQAQRGAYAAYVDTGRFVVCSASPELFLGRDGERVWSRPMKGTAPRGLTLAADRAQAAALASSAKDRAENVMIVDMVRNDLGRVARTGSVRVPRLFEVERYPTLWQMVSEVACESEASLLELLKATFPPASITGAPKARTMALIAELECSPRRVYTGCVGMLGPGRRAQLNVAIRTMVIDRASGTAEYGVGGGVVWDSSAAAELAEARTKARILRHPVPAFELLETLGWDPAGGYRLRARHLARLRGSAEYFGYALDPAAVQAGLDAIARGFTAGARRVRLRLAEDGAIALEASPLDDAPAGQPWRVAFAREPVDPADVFLYHKTTHRRVYEAARAGRPGHDDVLLWNHRGEVTETTTANVVADLDGNLCTPPVSCGLLAGTYRDWLIDGGRVTERVLGVEEVARARGLWLVNSVRGKVPATLDLATRPRLEASPGGGRSRVGGAA